MSSLFTLNPEHGYVAAAVVGSVIVQDIWMSAKVYRARRKYRIPYPNQYGDEVKHKQFNCMQRAHMNTVEYSSHYYAALLTAGVQYPVVAGIGGLIYNIGRIFYFKRYSSGDPEKRHLGTMVTYIGFLMLLGAAGKTAFDLVRQKY
ncbi:hypothetical protein H632_c3353p0 [Helicosporidium sp. ATCC 50920]|nr:hypothetical protein H632_c3353p0 [Helicosporidium sp. ATCC 50920]|eukprot:KDD72433.1 hypothetical protein H632_c3353p0 [Helicosporidium sp. ATCC 50920]